MNRLVMNDGKVTKERPAPPPAPLPPMAEQPRNHVWYLLRGVWYPISRQTARGKGYPFQEDEPEGTRCEDWRRRIDVING